MKLSEINTQEHIKCLVFGDSGSGKCLGYGTEILMYDGSIKEVQDIEVGDEIMGPDSKKRNVLSLGRGRDKMFEITPTKGSSFTCNSEHILTLWNQNKKELFDIELNKFQERFKSESGFCLQRTGVDFKEKKWKSKLSPYQLGIWIGDGHMRNPCVTKNDEEVLNEWKEVAKKFEVPFRIKIDKRNGVKTASAQFIGSGSGFENPVQKELKKFKSECNHKIIPLWAKTSSRENRLNLLAGLIDTDGYQHNNCIEFSNKLENIVEDFCFISRSLGFACYKKAKVVNGDTYWIASLSGDLSIIPIKIERKKCEKRKQIKSVLRTGFSIDEIGDGDYYGFTIDGDRRFLLGDFTITHNTVFATGFPTPLHVFDFDCKVSSAASFYKGQERLDEITFDSLPFSDKKGQMLPGKFLNERLGELKKLGQEGKFPYKTIVIDSLTTANDRLMEYLMSENPGVKRVLTKGGQAPALQDYGIFRIFMKNFISEVLSLPCNVVFTAHIETVKDEESGRVINLPMLTGKLSKELPIYFEEVYLAKVVGEGSARKHVLQTQSDRKFSCRSQRGLPDEIETSYENLIKNMR